MVKWVKLFREQYLGFWILGPVLFALQEIPYILMPLFSLETNPIMNMPESSVILDVCEKALGSACIVFMLFIVHKNAVLFSVAKKAEKVFFLSAAAVLSANFIGWAFYFSGRQSLFVIMFFIVLLPPLYYVFIGLWRKNILLTSAGALFCAVHFIHVAGNLKVNG